MYYKTPIEVLLAVIFFVVQASSESKTLNDDSDKIDLRRELDKMTQDLLVKKDPFYHSYVFNSGVGNREKLSVDWMKQASWFPDIEGVISWQEVWNMGQIYLLGQKLTSVTLVTATAQLSQERSTQFQQHTLSFEANITSVSLFTKRNPPNSEPEVVVVVAVDTSAADIIFYKINNGKLDVIMQWSHYKKISVISTVNVNRKNQLIIVAKGSPASVDVYEISFVPDSVKLDFRRMQSFTVKRACVSAIPCRVGRQHYLMLQFPDTLSVYRLISENYEKHTQLSLPRVSQVVCFNVALQTYLAVNGDTAHVLRLNEAGDIVSELMPGYVSEWLVLPVSSYRSDILLLSRVANATRAYVWAGANQGFDAITLPECTGTSCLNGNWLGAVAVPFPHQNCLLIPQAQQSTNLVVVGTSLHSFNPLEEKRTATVKNMMEYQDEWNLIKSRLVELEETLRYVVKSDGTNEISGRWTIQKLKTSILSLNSMIQPEKDMSDLEKTAGKMDPSVEALETAVSAVIAQGNEVIEAVSKREEEAWGLDGFKGKVSFKTKLIVDNLTISHLNNEQMDHLLRNTFRKDRAEKIQSSVTATTLKTKNILFNKIKSFTRDDLKFSDGPVVLSGNATFDHPLTVRGEVELEEGRVNGLDLSEEFCQGRIGCSVFPNVSLSEEDLRIGDFNNNINTSPTISPSDKVWSKVIAGQNLTVGKVNGLDWRTLTENVVYMNTYQNITGTVLVKGKVLSHPAVWADSFQYLDETVGDKEDFPILEAFPSENKPTYADRKGQILARADLVWGSYLSSASKVIVSELEVTGTVSCEESEWGREAVDVILSDANPIVIEAKKTFDRAVNVTNNANVKGTVGGVEVADLLTRDTDQEFYGPTALQGNITVENLRMTGLYNEMNLTEVLEDRNLITADSVNVLETINGVPVSDLVLTADDEVTAVQVLNANEIYVTKDIAVNGVVCGFNLDSFNEKRLSLQKDQTISGNVSIKNATITEGFFVKKLNETEISSSIGDSDESYTQPTIHLSELHVDGDIITESGINNFNLSNVGADAIWLESNNVVEGSLIFKDEVSFDVLECQDTLNGVMCDHWLDIDDVVFKHNKSVIFKGNKTFVNSLNITKNLEIQEINEHNVQDIFTKTTDQEISGDLTINGDIRVVEDTTVLGLMNDLNITEFGHRCSVAENTITCRGNALFKDNVVISQFNISGKMNEVEFNNFLESVVRTDSPQEITGSKTFSGNVEVESLKDVKDLNGESWDDFLRDSVRADNEEHVDHLVKFSEILIVSNLSVDFHMEADTFNSINITSWKTDAIFIDKSYALQRELRLESASSRGSIAVEEYGGLDMEQDIIRLHSTSHLPFLRAKGVTVLGSVDVQRSVNGKYLIDLEQNTLKTVGNQVVESDLIVGELSIDGNMATKALVNERQLRDVVTTSSDQTLSGEYEFDCFEANGNVDSSEVISGINLTSWMETGVVMNGREQVISGSWQVQDCLELKGLVAGKGRLGDADLQQLTDLINKEVLDVHAEMKSNLTKACEETNAQLASARSQHCKLLSLDIIQQLNVPSGPSLVSHFQSDDEDYLAVSENSCTTTIYKWNKNTEKFTILQQERFGFALKRFIILKQQDLTYVLTESKEISSDCEYFGKHLWIFMKDHFKHISAISFFDGELIQGEENNLYVMNSSGMFKYILHFNITQGRAFFNLTPHSWNITKDTPKEWSSVIRHEWLIEVLKASNSSGEVISVSVDPAAEFVAVASTEPAQVPRHADYIKVYRRDGRLFDKLPAQQVNQLQWLAVPTQTWLVALQNDSIMNLYQLQNPLLGFQLHMSALTDANHILSITLPQTSKVNLQPFIVMQSSSAIKIVQAIVQGDPYLGKNLNCNFEKILNRIPRK